MMEVRMCNTRGCLPSNYPTNVPYVANGRTYNKTYLSDVGVSVKAYLAFESIDMFTGIDSWMDVYMVL